MAASRRSGDVVRIRGRGTFVAPGPQPVPAVDRAQQVSAASLAGQLMAGIGRGELKRTEPLPSQKQLAAQFHVAPATVARACRELAAQGLLTRIGTRWFVGRFAALVRGETRKQVYLFATDAAEFRGAFRSDFLAHSYRRLHHELSANGFVLLFATWDELPGHLAQWVRSRRMPYGVVFYKVSNERIELVRALAAGITRAAREAREPPPPVLVDFHRNPPASRVAGHVLLRSHLSTSVARETAAFTALRGYRRVCFFHDVRVPYDIDSGYSWSSVWPVLKLRNELRIAAPAVPFRLIAGNAGRPFSVDRYLGRHMGSLTETTASAVLKAYGMRSLWDIAGECIAAPVFAEYYPELAEPGTLWVFAADRLAVEALEWARNHEVRVPQDLALVGLESDLDCLPAGITCVEPDLDTLGYLMAQAVIGDMPVTKTTRGYLRTPAIVRERLTT